MRIGYHPDKKCFARRRRTLPSNGVKVIIEGNPLIEEIKMKELYHADSIHMIARFRLKAGDYLVRFNTMSGLFLSTFLNSTNPEATLVHDLLESAALWLYALYVLDDVGDWEKYFDGKITEKEAVGGKLRKVYGSSKKKDKDNLEQSDRTINGYVRRLPVGQKASDEAIDRARKLGYDLNESETYVQSFIRSSWVVKTRS